MIKCKITEIKLSPFKLSVLSQNPDIVQKWISGDETDLVSNMSQVYINEPPTHGKVCLETTVGEIEIELFSRECPKTCRNFVQLCMENYYDRTKFHRVVRDFIVQGGDPTGTGQGKKLKATVKFMNIKL